MGIAMDEFDEYENRIAQSIRNGAKIKHIDWMNLSYFVQRKNVLISIS